MQKVFEHDHICEPIYLMIARQLCTKSSFAPAKKGAADWTDPPEQGQQADAGGGEPELAHGRTGGQCPAG
jgi:hypothetical protein